MNGSNRLNDFRAANGPPASDPRGCEYFTSRVHTNSSVVHAGLMNDLGQPGTEQLIKYHSFIHIVLDDHYFGMFRNDAGYSF